ncbi:MAG: response regulator transcription factor [Phototrophicaceae bacterium]|jgi:DNA-binding response OmpR family regulator
MGRQVLIVEDDRELNWMYALKLRKLDYVCHQAYTIESAMDYLKSNSAPDFMVLDLELPDGLGTQVLDYVAQQGTYDHTQIIVVSGVAFSKEHNLQKYNLAGALIKPITPRELLVYINSLTPQ